MSIESILYTAQATAIGGREGHATSSDRSLDIVLSTPKELGGTGGTGTNPEQLFAAGYSACFLGALRYVAGQEHVALPDTAAVTGRVGIGAVSTGFAIDVALTVSLPGVNREVADDLVRKAHVVCPYSHATRNNINVALILA
ncbi:MULTISPECIES: organic hydroperoxide resistance protein [Stenotrophomonas]|uniref:organic hydroperoxide resistance protein n=1 Tax=Stenotrophomonas TaxID=40323 RepID=UPI0015DF0F06|nr:MULTISPECIES: organic hydroperoxide resistance protein [Stenotrophomonas]MBA0328036.1 organic hydroperoxide resistance protein [Stenotrophomonas maltophilia]MBN7849950.1 organic hydroperoxide resistance protein [Stenotrophomonas maltophilia]MCR1003497.1 organic hydroperoxide resistance protein [Stenotrophomonas maltophilia]MCR1571614.1 organic hydroperoxide resistance protein [Stenotrophomonas sp.]